MPETYGYARCSTDELRQDIDRQRRDLKALGVESDDKIYFEYASGARQNRPELQKLLQVIKPGDTIIATEVSRLTRSTRQLCDIMQTVQDKKLRLIIGSSFTVDCRSGDNADPMTKGMLLMWGVFAEMERDITSERVRSGMKNAKAKGKRIGRPKTTKADIPKKFWHAYNLYKEEKITLTDAAAMIGCSRGTMYKYISIVEKEKTSKS